MRQFVIVLALAVLAAASIDTNPSLAAIHSFSSWMKQHGKVYSNEHFLYRLDVFRRNQEFIDQHNTEGHEYTLKMNQFGDLTHEEFISHKRPEGVSQTRVAKPAAQAQTPAVRTSSNDVDWTMLMTAVRDQGFCEAGYAFAVTGAMEGWLQIKQKAATRPNLSEQDLVDCVGGCPSSSGDKTEERIANALRYYQTNGPVLGMDYPYISDYMGQPGTCHPMTSSRKVEWKPTSVTTFTTESDMLAQLQLGPVAVAMNVDEYAFQFYYTGVYTKACSNTNLNHALTLVGFGTTDGGVPYWKLKNCYGDYWGESGYVRVKRGVGLCGIGKGAVPVFA